MENPRLKYAIAQRQTREPRSWQLPTNPVSGVKAESVSVLKAKHANISVIRRRKCPTPLREAI